MHEPTEELIELIRAAHAALDCLPSSFLATREELENPELLRKRLAEHPREAEILERRLEGRET